VQIAYRIIPNQTQIALMQEGVFRVGLSKKERLVFCKENKLKKQGCKGLTPEENEEKIVPKELF
jgi:hypothetical protein